MRVVVYDMCLALYGVAFARGAAVARMIVRWTATAGRGGEAVVGVAACLGGLVCGGGWGGAGR